MEVVCLLDGISRYFRPRPPAAFVALALQSRTKLFSHLAHLSSDGFGFNVVGCLLLLAVVVVAVYYYFTCSRKYIYVCVCTCMV